MVIPIPASTSDNLPPIGYILVRPSDTIVLSVVAEETSLAKPYHIASANTPTSPYCGVAIPTGLALPQPMFALMATQICSGCLAYCLQPDQQALRPYNRSLYIQGTIIDLDAQKEAHRLALAKQQFAEAFAAFVRTQQVILMQMQQMIQKAGVIIDPAILQSIFTSAITEDSNPDAPQQVTDPRLSIVASLGDNAWLIVHDDAAFQDWREAHLQNGFVCNLRDTDCKLHHANCSTLAANSGGTTVPKIVGTSRTRVENAGVWIRHGGKIQTCNHCLAY